MAGARCPDSGRCLHSRSSAIRVSPPIPPTRRGSPCRGCARGRRGGRPRTAARRPVGASRPATGRRRSGPVHRVRPGPGSVSRPRSRGLTKTTRPGGMVVPPRSTSRVVTRAVSQVGGVRRSVSHTALIGSTARGSWASHANRNAPAAMGTWIPAASSGRRLLRGEVDGRIRSERVGESVLESDAGRRAPCDGRGPTATDGGARRSRARVRRSTPGRGRPRGRGRRHWRRGGRRSWSIGPRAAAAGPWRRTAQPGRVRW